MMRTIAVASMLWVCLSVTVCPAAGGENIAAGRPYRLTPRPNYKHCTDAGDRTQLTDGKYSKGHFWVQKPTVGWSNATVVTITIDLGAVAPIGGVSFSTAAGVAGVHWPMAILILVSDDGKTYRHVGDLAGLSAADGYTVRRFRTDKLATRGRYVKLMVVGNGAYVFVDEIEVYRGAKELLDRPPGGEAITDVGRFLRRRQVTVGVRRRLRADLSAVAAAAKAAKVSPAELSDVAKQIDAVTVDAVDDFRTVLPLNDLHRRIFAVQAAVWRTRLAGPLVLWQKNRWDMLSPTEPPRKGGARLDVSMMRREVRGAAFQISNVSPKPVACRLRFASPRPKYVRVYEVPFTDTKSGVVVAAAMPEARREADAWRVDIPAGMTRQVWVTFGPDTPPAGEHRGRLVVEPGDLSAPVRLKVYPLTFPPRPALHLCGWDYTDRDRCYNVTPANRSAVIRMLREYHVDAPWAQRSTMPAGVYDRTGKMIRPPDEKSFRTWLARWPDARMYLVFVSVSSRFAGFEMGSAAFRTALTAWINGWVRRLGQLGVPPEKLGLLLVDEPHSHEQDRIIIEYAKVIRAAQPKVVIWQDPTWREPWKATPQLFQVSDVLCPNLPMWIAQGKRFADFYAAQRRGGRELWFYSCSGPGKLLDPYSYHRMQQWFCWKHGAKGSGFWAFGDSNGASSWNEYLSGRGAYTPLFLDDKTVTRGKHMEAIREGVQDYEYLRMLRDRIAALAKTSPAHPRLPAARALLAGAANRVTACMTNVGQIYWQRPKDRGTADRVRVEVLDMLVSLQRERNPRGLHGAVRAQRKP